jgi:hypothetical protein
MSARPRKLAGLELPFTRPEISGVGLERMPSNGHHD